MFCALMRNSVRCCLSKNKMPKKNVEVNVMFKLILGLALVLLAIYIFKTKLEGSKLERIGVYVAIIGILIAIIGVAEPKVEKDNKLGNSSDENIQSDENNGKNDKTENISEKPIVEENNEPSVDLSTDETNKSETSTKVETNNESESENNTNNVLPEPTVPDISQSSQPVPIRKLILKSSSANYNISQTEFDPRGKIYTNVIRLDSSATNGIGYRGKLELYTERKYSTFSCSFVPEANYSTNSGAGAYIEIYKDDVLAYTSDLITYKTISIEVNLDIQDVQYLKIKIINVNKNYPYMANADTLLCNAYVIE